MPIARHPLIFAIWPTTEPTAPAAPDTTTVSPALGLPMSRRPKYAVMPGMPRTPRYTGSGAKRVSTFCTPLPSEIAYSCTPKAPATKSPALNPGCFDALTTPAPPARITSPISTGRMYDLPSFIQPRMAGSSDSCRIFTRISPSRGSFRGSSVNCQSLRLGSPTGLAARRT